MNGKNRSYHKKIQLTRTEIKKQNDPDMFIEWNPAINEITVRIEAKEIKESWETTLKVKQNADINCVVDHIREGVKVASRCCSTKDFMNRVIVALRRLETFEAFKNEFLQ